MSTPAVQQAVSRVMASGHYVGGPEVEALEADVAAWMGRQHGVGVSSGTAALELAMTAMGVGPGDEVILPAVSFVATLGAVLRVGAEPVIVDVLPEGPWMDPEAVKAARTERTALVIPVHLFGRRAESGADDLPVLDDACQAVMPGGVSVGRCTALSFYPTKILGGPGEGGMILTDDTALATRLRQLRQHGADSAGVVQVAGGTNARLGALAAAVVRARMPTMADRMTRHRQIAEVYDAALGTHALPRAEDPTVYVLRHPERVRVADALESAGIPTAVYYPRCVHEHPAHADRVHTPGPLQHAQRYCAESLALPFHAGLSDEDVAHIVATLEAVL